MSLHVIDDLWMHDYDVNAIYVCWLISCNLEESPDLAVMLLDFHQIGGLKINLLWIMMVTCVKKKKDLSPLFKGNHGIKLSINFHN